MNETNWTAEVAALYRDGLITLQVYRDYGDNTKRGTDHIVQLEESAETLGTDILTLLDESRQISQVPPSSPTESRQALDVLMEKLGETKRQTFRNRYQELTVSRDDAGQIQVLADLKNASGGYLSQEWRTLEPPVTADQLTEAFRDMIGVARAAAIKNT